MTASATALALSAASCATGGCHGGPEAGNRAVQSFAATLWATRDPHAKAFETLHTPRSRRMAQLLGIGEPHRARQCLMCHSVQAEREPLLPPEILADGVSCGSCHGDATRWFAVHQLPAWKTLSAEDRATLGYRSLEDVGARARTCVACHVGDDSREVGHDLIAAGHPRLAFEFSASQRLWPRHWSPHGKAESRTDFAERSWAAGQAETLAATARLLATRAGRTAAEIEAGGPVHGVDFAEFDCYACHRALSPERVALTAAGPFRNPTPGVPSWQPWSVSAARLVALAIDTPATDALGPAADDVRGAFGAAWADGDRATLDRATLDRAAARAAALEQAANAAARVIASQPTIVLDAPPDAIDATIAADRPQWRFWDAAAQTYLLMEATRDGGPARLGPNLSGGGAAANTRTALDELRASLRFPPGTGGPDRFEPVAFEHDRHAVP
ncbi:MAG: multiheme c-type cytochrome [Planctomycetaceae bacterium]